MMTTKEASTKLRAEYKALGWNSRMIGVSGINFSMGSELKVTIKDPAISYHKAKLMAENLERIDRCEFSGEILNGCNRYVMVGESKERQEILIRRHLDALEDALVRLDSVEGVIEHINDDVGICLDNIPERFRLYSLGDNDVRFPMAFQLNQWGKEAAALAIAHQDPDQL